MESGDVHFSKPRPPLLAALCWPDFRGVDQRVFIINTGDDWHGGSKADSVRRHDGSFNWLPAPVCC
jgi:hypothetical protein